MIDWVFAVVGLLSILVFLMMGWMTLHKLDAMGQQLTTITAVLVRTHLRMQSLDRALRGSDMPDDETLEQDAT